VRHLRHFFTKLFFKEIRFSIGSLYKNYRNYRNCRHWREKGQWEGINWREYGAVLTGRSVFQPTGSIKSIYTLGKEPLPPSISGPAFGGNEIH
jgi:hypothetical protein